MTGANAASGFRPAFLRGLGKRSGLATTDNQRYIDTYASPFTATSTPLTRLLTRHPHSDPTPSAYNRRHVTGRAAAQPGSHNVGVTAIDPWCCGTAQDHTVIHRGHVYPSPPA